MGLVVVRFIWSWLGQKCFFFACPHFLGSRCWAMGGQPMTHVSHLLAIVIRPFHRWAGNTFPASACFYPEVTLQSTPNNYHNNMWPLFLNFLIYTCIVILYTLDMFIIISCWQNFIIDYAYWFFFKKLLNRNIVMHFVNCFYKHFIFFSNIYQGYVNKDK